MGFGRASLLRHSDCFVRRCGAREVGGGQRVDRGKLSRAVVSGWNPIVAHLALDVGEWAAENFGSCELGDVRRTRRAVKMARQMAEHPDGSTPDQTEKWADLKAAYRLFERAEVTFRALAEPHWRATRDAARGVVLLISDTTETDFGSHRAVSGLGPTGNGGGRGFLLHSSLMVDPLTREILGLAGQELFYRQPKPKGETSYQAAQRDTRESEVWGRVIDLVGPPAQGVQYVHVFDRGADNLDVFCHLVQQHSDWVIRAAQLHRKVREVTSAGPGNLVALKAVLARQPVVGTYELEVRATPQQPARTARLEVRFAQVQLPRVARRTRYQEQVGFESLAQWVVEAREIGAPSGAEPVQWVLWTSLPVASFADAWRTLEYYEQRWVIEEFHKAIKTGCRLESRQYLTAHSLEAVAAITSILAVRLVQLKTVAKQQPQTPAEQVVPNIWLQMLRALRKAPIVTVRDFYRHLAGLGGFLMRKGDGEPGWLTLWRGTDKLILAIRGHQAMARKCG